MIYYIIGSYLFFIALITDIYKTKQFSKHSKFLFFISSVILILFVGLRINTGYDYDSYKNIFINIKTRSLHDSLTSGDGLVVEPGYLLINYIFRFLNYNQFIFIMALICLIPKMIFISKYSIKRNLCLFMYYGLYLCTYDMGIMRQSVALGIALWAYKALLEKKYKSFCGLVLLASLFHSSSLILLVLYLVKDRRFTLKFYIMTVVVAFAISNLSWINHIVYLIPLDFIKNKIWYYLYAYTNEETSIILSALKRIIIMIFFLVFLDWRKDTSKDNVVLYFNAFYMSIIFSLCLCEIPIMAGRGTAVLQISQIFLFTLLFDKNYCVYEGSQSRVWKVVCPVIVIAWVVYSLNAIISSNEYIMYHSILNM